VEINWRTGHKKDEPAKGKKKGGMTRKDERGQMSRDKNQNMPRGRRGCLEAFPPKIAMVPLSGRARVPSLSSKSWSQGRGEERPVLQPGRLWEGLIIGVPSS